MNEEFKIEIPNIDELEEKSIINSKLKYVVQEMFLPTVPTPEELTEISNTVLNWVASDGRFRTGIKFTWDKSTKDSELYLIQLYELVDALDTMGYEVETELSNRYTYLVTISWRRWINE